MHAHLMLSIAKRALPSEHCQAGMLTNVTYVLSMDEMHHRQPSFMLSPAYMDTRHACCAHVLTFVRPVYENMPIWLMMWSQVPGAPTSFKAECSFSRIVMILSAMPFSSTCNTSIGIQALSNFSPLNLQQVHYCIRDIKTSEIIWQ